MPNFSISHEAIGGAIDLITVSGSLDAHSFEEFETAVNNLFAQGRFKIIVDMANLDYISSAGAGVFIAAHTEAEENGAKLVLLSPTKTVAEAFDILGLTEVFSTAKDREEAMAAF